MHGCPHYGPVIYDDEGYNQDGYHRTTGLNREGRTRREQARFNPDGDDEDEDEDGDEEDNPDDHHFVLQHVDAAMRATFAALPHQDREAFLLNLQIQLFEERGITFPLPDERSDDSNESDGDGDGDSDGDNENEDSGSEDDDDGRDEGEGQDSNDEEQSNEGPGEDVEGEGQSTGALPTNAATPDDLRETFNELNDALVGMAEELDAVTAEAMQGIEQLENGETSSAASPDQDLLGTPMDVDSIEEEDKQEREPWMGTPGSWPNDEELD